MVDAVVATAIPDETTTNTGGTPPTPTPSPAASATEPAVVSSANISENVIPQNQNDLAKWDAGGLTVDDQGLARYSDGSYAAAPSNAAQNEDGTYSAGGVSYAIGPNTHTDPDLQAMYDQLSQAKQGSDANTLSTIKSIEQQYGGLISGAQSATVGNNKAIKNAMLLSGTARYAPADAASMSTIQMQRGLATISNLQAQENDAISKAQTASSANDQKLLDQWLTIAKQARQDKQTAAASLAKTVATTASKQQTTNDTASIDAAIEKEIAAGNTDPGKILTNLNAAGLSGVTAAQVSKSLGDLMTTTGAADIKSLTGDVKNFEALSQIPGGLPSSILALPQDQQLPAYIAMVHAAAKGTVVSGATITGTGAGATLATPAGEPISVGMTAQGDPDPSDQNTFLASLPGGASGEEATLIKGLANYTINPASLPTRQYKGVSGMTQAQAIALAAQYDPTFDSKSYATRAAMQKNITSGSYSQTIAAANTAIAHLALLSAAAKSLPGYNKDNDTAPVGDPGATAASQSRNMPFINALRNKIATSFGGAGATNFNTEASAVGSELAKVYKGTGAPSEGEIENWQSSINPNMSNAQIEGSIQAAINLMAGKLSTLSQNYSSVMGKQGDFQILTPTSIRTLEALGIDPSTVDPTYDSSQDPGGSHPSDLLSEAAAPDTSSSSAGSGDTSSFWMTQ